MDLLEWAPGKLAGERTRKRKKTGRGEAGLNFSGLAMIEENRGGAPWQMFWPEGGRGATKRNTAGKGLAGAILSTLGTAIPGHASLDIRFSRTARGVRKEISKAAARGS